MSNLGHSRASVSSRLSVNSSNIKLRTVVKYRDGRYLDPQSKEGSASRLMMNGNGRLPSLPSSSTKNYETLSNEGQTIRGNSVKRAQDPINCEEEDLILKRDGKYERIRNKLDDLNRKAEDLIQRKLFKVGSKQRSISLRDKGGDELSEGLEQIIKSIRNLRLEELDDCEMGKEDLKNLMDHKINLLEKLMAEKNTESEILKKYFFAISAINQRKKFSTEKVRFKTYSNSRLDEFNSSPQKKPVSNESENKMTYKAPKPDEYETYRYKRKEYSANLQPLPRSSYNREFLTYNAKKQNISCRNMDNHSFFNRTRDIGTTYNKDYSSQKTKLVDYRELDSYRDKFKDLQVLYLYNKKEMPAEQLEQNKRCVREQMKQTLEPKMERISGKIPIPKLSVTSPMQVTESRREYSGHRGMTSTIKNKDLNKLKYAYRSMIHA